MRQFDVFVFDNSSEFNSWKPSLEDEALGWFHTRDWNKDLNQLEAEWIVFAHPHINIDREFLNELALATDGFPMVDAFAPRVRLNGEFYGGLLINGTKGFSPISDREELRYVAGPNPFVAAFSRRIIQRTGFFDTDLPENLRLLDYALRMAHAGGKMFSIPYLVAKAFDEKTSQEEAAVIKGNYLDRKDLVPDMWTLMYKNLPNGLTLKYSMRHPSMMGKYFKTPKDLEEKREKAVLLSKLSEKRLQEISVKKK